MGTTHSSNVKGISIATKTCPDIRNVAYSSDQVIDQSVIAAIDFGTSSSGYAFAFRDENSDDIKMSEIQLNKWQLGTASSSTAKAPTTVLLKPDKTFDSFGYKAEDKYARLCDTRQQKGWWYFQKFKMMLYETKLSREVMLHDAEDKPMSAKYVLSVVIGHLKGCVLEDVMSQNPSITDDDIMYVLTVPAIWSDAAKQFMKEAATDPIVGMKDSQLTLVLEPEAASVFCRQRKSRVVRDPLGNTKLDSLEIGHKYIILDLGGGTADIATHEIIENGQMHEIDYARGDNLGGQKFNENFLQFLSDLFGVETFKKWRLSQHGDYLRLQRAIEGIKWEIKDPHQFDDDIYFEIPYSLAEHVKNETGKSVEEKLSKSVFNYAVKIEQTVKFISTSTFVRGFFETILTGVAQHLSNIRKNTNTIKTVFVVGGLAQSSYVVNYIKTKFPQYTLIVPEDPGVAVLKGAVMLGNKPQTIAGRIASYSYGIGLKELFAEGKHDEKYKVTRDGRVLCKNIFRKLIEKGQVLKYGDKFTIMTSCLNKMAETKHRVVEIVLYQSTSDNPTYVTEPGCTQLCGIDQYPPEGGWPDITRNEVQIVVGEAQFRFYVTNSLGCKYETTADFFV